MYSGKSVVYEYDGGGNIVTKKEYGYTTGALGEVQKTVSYGYDEVWKDLLKSYDGQAIAYDWVKNPLTWRDGLSFTWSNGRQLTGATKDGTALSFGYNSDGLRLHRDGGDEPDRLRMGWVRPAGGTDEETTDPVPVRQDGPDRVQAERGHIYICVQRTRGRDGDP